MLRSSNLPSETPEFYTNSNNYSFMIMLQILLIALYKPASKAINKWVHFTGVAFYFDLKQSPFLFCDIYVVILECVGNILYSKMYLLKNAHGTTVAHLLQTLK